MDPKLITLPFNEAINQQNKLGLTSLMTEDHRIIDRSGEVVNGKGNMVEGWARLFELFPEDRNTFTRVESKGNLVILYGYATWMKGEAPEHAFWTAKIEDGLVAEWRIYEDTEENKKKFKLSE